MLPVEFMPCAGAFVASPPMRTGQRLPPLQLVFFKLYTGCAISLGPKAVGEPCCIISSRN